MNRNLVMNVLDGAEGKQLLLQFKTYRPDMPGISVDPSAPTPKKLIVELNEMAIRQEIIPETHCGTLGRTISSYEEDIPIHHPEDFEYIFALNGGFDRERFANRFSSSLQTFRVL